MAGKPRVYLAGPGVFRPDARAFGEMLKQKCNRAGLVGCFPLDNELDGPPGKHIAAAIYRGNVQLIDSVQAIIADISPFRGPNMDPGTAWEIGYAVAKGLHVYSSSSDPAPLLERTQRQAGVRRKGDAFVDEIDWTIENFDLAENLMITHSCASIHRTEDEAILACASALVQKGG